MPSLSPKRRAHAHAGQARSASTSISRVDGRLACGNPYLTLRCTQLGSDWHQCLYAKKKKKKKAVSAFSQDSEKPGGAAPSPLQTKTAG